MADTKELKIIKLVPTKQDPPQEPLPSPIETADVESAEVESDKPNEPHFQAIGTLYGVIQKDEEDKFVLQLGQQQYRLFIPGYRFRAWLKQTASFPETPLFLRVYPKCLIIPRKDILIYFQVIAWGTENPWDEAPGIFIFKGIWQFLPQLKTPVISVYRNRGAEDPTGKFKASHLPILMRREDDVRPFRFNPKIPKEQLPKRWFIQALFKFIPTRQCWGWVDDLYNPIDFLPKYEKPVKPETPYPNESSPSETPHPESPRKELPRKELPHKES